MPGSFGARLRKRREDQGLGLSMIAEQTKIKRSLLEALERDDVSHWPSGIFRRAYIRAYAHAIGLNADVVVREFLEVHPEAAEVVGTPSAIASATTGVPTDAGPPTRLRYILESAIGAVSRLRRRRAVTDGVVVAGTPVNAPTTGEPDSPPHCDLPPHPDLPPSPSQGPPRVDRISRGAGDRAASKLPVPSDPDLPAVAHLVTELGRVQTQTDLQRLLQQAGDILDAVGLIVWVWDPLAAELRPVLVHGYSDEVVAQLPPVTRDSDNATAAAFRSAQTCAISSCDQTTGALVVPLLPSAGCVGVLAIELRHGNEDKHSVRAIATILAASLAQIIDAARAGRRRRLRLEPAGSELPDLEMPDDAVRSLRLR